MQFVSSSESEIFSSGVPGSEHIVFQPGGQHMDTCISAVGHELVKR